jgi:HAD superfamily hydrolase (TIGR01509 family)
MIKLIIFDLDGVLVDACEWHRAALNCALKEIANYEIPPEEHHMQFNGIPTRVKLRRLVERGILKEEYIGKIESLKQEKTIAIINNLAVISQEKIDLVQYLKLKNIKVACYTNSIRMTAQLMLKKTGILEYFDLLITNQDVTTPKPSPEGYLLCLQHFNVSPTEAIIVEDSPKGLEAARASGCKCIEVSGTNQVNIDLLKSLL